VIHANVIDSFCEPVFDYTNKHNVHMWATSYVELYDMMSSIFHFETICCSRFFLYVIPRVNLASIL
jgi:hypothetical protein